MTPQQELDAYVDMFAPKIRNAFRAAISGIVDNVLLKQLVTYIENGDVEGAFRSLGFSDAAMRPLTAMIEQAYEQGGVLTGATFPKFINTTSGRGVFRFDVRNSRAEAYLRNKSSELITRISEEARLNVRNTLTVGMQDGRNPRNVALDIVGRIDPRTKQRVGGIIGLTTDQEQWVRNARTKLVQLDASYFNLKLRDARFDRTVQAAIRDGKPLSADIVEKLVLRYKDKALQYRGETIGRTEANQSLNASEYEATRQAVDLGATKASAIQREWDDTGDRRTRTTHRLLNGQRVGLEEPFVSVSGARMMFPGDTSLGAPGKEVIMCRCRAKSVIDWFDGVD